MKKNIAKKKRNIETYKKSFLIYSLIFLISTVLIGYLAYQYIYSIETNPLYNNSNFTDINEIDGEIISYKYNGFDFVKKDGVWYTEIQKGSQPYIIAVQYGPIELEDLDIEFKPNLFPILTEPLSKVYVSFDHDTKQASYIATASINLIANMKTVWHLNVLRACLINSTSCSGAPIVTCESHPNNAVIMFKESNTTKVLYEDNCLSIEASKDEFIRAVDKIILNWYKII